MRPRDSVIDRAPQIGNPGDRALRDVLGEVIAQRGDVVVDEFTAGQLRKLIVVMTGGAQ